MDQERLYTVDEVAAACRVTSRTVRRWLKRGLRCTKLGRGRNAPVRIPAEELDRWRALQEVRAEGLS